jgi:hypothetical protein
MIGEFRPCKEKLSHVRPIHVRIFQVSSRSARLGHITTGYVKLEHVMTC